MTQWILPVDFELPTEPCLLTQWRPAFRLALNWCAASGCLRAAGYEDRADEYLQHALDILDTLEARI